MNKKSLLKELLINITSIAAYYLKREEEESAPLGSIRRGVARRRCCSGGVGRWWRGRAWAADGTGKVTLSNYK